MSVSPNPADDRPVAAAHDDNAGFDRAVDWLLNSRWVDQGALDHFWHMTDGKECSCDFD